MSASRKRRTLSRKPGGATDARNSPSVQSQLRSISANTNVNGANPNITRSTCSREVSPWSDLMIKSSASIIPPTKTRKICQCRAVRKKPSPRLVMVDVKEVAIHVCHRELPEAPRFLLERIHNVGSGRFQLGVRRFDVRREHPMNNRLERQRSLP